MEYKDKVVIVNGGAQAAMTIDTTNLCSHLQKKLFEPEGVYYPIWQAMQNDEELTAVFAHDSFIFIVMVKRFSFSLARLSRRLSERIN